MKRRILLRNSEGNVFTYVTIMLGMAFILYIFGFQAMYTTWSTTSDINESLNITDPELNKGDFISVILDPINLLAAGTATLLGVGLIINWFIGKGTTVIWQYVIPAIILLALNIFVFPINALTDDMQSISIVGFPIAAFLLIFFNLFYIFGVIDFIRGPT